MKSFEHLDSGLKLTHQESVLWPLVDPCYGCCQYAIQQQVINKRVQLHFSLKAPNSKFCATNSSKITHRDCNMAAFGLT